MFKELSGIALFQNIHEEKLVEAFQKIHYQIREYQSDAVIAYAGDACEHLYILLEGRVRGELVNFKGKNVVVDDIYAPNTFAEAFLFAKQNKILVNIVASTEVKIIRVPKEEFLRLLHLESAILESYLNATANRFVTVSQKLRFLTMKSVKQKMAHYLLALQRENKEGVFFPLGKTHEALAALFGITRPALTKNILELRRDNIIEVKDKKVKILNEQALMEFLDN